MFVLTDLLKKDTKLGRGKCCRDMEKIREGTWRMCINPNYYILYYYCLWNVNLGGSVHRSRKFSNKKKEKITMKTSVLF